MKRFWILILVTLVPTIAIYAQEKIKGLKQIKESSLSIPISPLSKKGKWGYADNNGKFLIHPIFDLVEPFDKSTGTARVKYHSKWGVLRRDATVIIEPQFDSIRPYIGKYAIVENNHSLGLISRSGLLLQPNYSSILSTKSNHWIVKSDQGFGVVDTLGAIIIPINHRRLYYVRDKDELCGYVCQDIREKFIVYDGHNLHNYGGQFDDICIKGLKEFSSIKEYGESNCLSPDYLCAKKEKKYGILSDNGTVLVSPFSDSIPSFHSTYVACLGTRNGKICYSFQNKLYSLMDFSQYLYENNLYSQHEEIPSWAKIQALSSNGEGSIWVSKEEMMKIWHLKSFTSNLSSDKIRLLGETIYTERKDGNIYEHPVISEIYPKGSGYRLTLYRSIVDEKAHLAILTTHEPPKLMKDILISDLYSSLVKERPDNYTSSKVLGATTMRNGDIVLYTSAQFVESKELFVYDVPRYVNIMGSPVLINPGFTQNTTYGDDYFMIFLDSNTYKVKKIFSIGPDTHNVYFRKKGGWYVLNGNLCRYDENGNLLWCTELSNESTYYNLEESDNYVYVCGSTRKSGYIGYDNPIVYQFSLDKGELKNTLYSAIKDKILYGIVIVNRNIYDASCFYEESRTVDGMNRSELPFISPLYDLKDGKPSISFKHLHTSLAGIPVSGFGAKNIKGNWVINPVVEEGMVGKYGQWEIYPEEEEGVALFSYKGRFGLLDYSCEDPYIPPVFEKAEDLLGVTGVFENLSSSKYFAYIINHSKIGYAKYDGGIIIPAIYDFSSASDGHTDIDVFVDRYFLVGKDNGDSWYYGLVDQNNQVIVPIEYDMIKYENEELLCIKDENTIHYSVANDGNLIIK